MGLLVTFAVIVVALLAVVVYDVTQKRHTILRNFPIIGHFRFLLEKVGPELRQYIVTSNDAERPFSRDQRSWVYASAKLQNNYSGFGTDNDLESTQGHILVKHVAFPAPEPTPGMLGAGPDFQIPCAMVIGERHQRAKAFRPPSIVNVSAMSYGALGPHAVEAINRGAHAAGCMHNTGEGGLTVHHQHGADLVMQLGTAYFGARDKDGRFSLERLLALCADNPIRMIEIKLSQGAKPGHGGILPAAKVTPEIARIRGVEPWVDCISPPYHTAFSDVPTMIEFIEHVAAETGLPVGIKSAIGEMSFWEELARRMATDKAGPDFITIDGGEGGTGAAPYTFADHVSLPFRTGMSRVRKVFARVGIHAEVPFIGSAKLGFPEHALMAMALGCDMINVAREAMLAVGCIQAQRCHLGTCPTGVATLDKRLNRGLVPDEKAPRLRNYIVNLRRELLELSRTVGVPHPSLVRADAIELVDEHNGSLPLTKLYDMPADGALPPHDSVRRLLQLLEARNPQTAA